MVRRGGDIETVDLGKLQELYEVRPQPPPHTSNSLNAVPARADPVPAGSNGEGEQLTDFGRIVGEGTHEIALVISIGCLGGRVEHGPVGEFSEQSIGIVSKFLGLMTRGAVT
jgi:hypothetical protein